MKKSQVDDWDDYKRKKFVRDSKFNSSDFPKEFNTYFSKKLILDDELLKLIWLIRKKNPHLRSEKQVVRESLKRYYDSLNK